MTPIQRLVLAGVLLAALAAHAPSARADIAPQPLLTGGASPRARGEDAVPVRMEWEIVDLYPSAERNRVEASFGLRNTSDRAVAFEVGFPSYYEGRLHDFTVTVDGAPVEPEVKRDDPPEGARKRIFTYWMCWPMTFEPGVEVRVDVRYWCETGKTFEHLWLEKLPAELKHQLWTRRSGYVLRTGAAWAGTIGKATIRLHYAGDVNKESLTFVSGRRVHGDASPAGAWTYEPASKIDTLVLKEFEPIATDDVAYEFTLAGPPEAATLLMATLRTQRLDPWAMERLLELVEKEDALNLDAPSRAAKVREILGWMVPPKGPRFPQSGPGALSAGAEGVLRRAFQRLLPLMEEEGDPAAYRAVLVEYRDFLEPIVQRKQAWYDAHPDKQKGRSWADHQRLAKQWRALVEATADD